jgi:hypothetical protein
VVVIAATNLYQATPLAKVDLAIQREAQKFVGLKAIHKCRGVVLSSRSTAQLSAIDIFAFWPNAARDAARRVGHAAKTTTAERCHEYAECLGRVKHDGKELELLFGLAQPLWKLPSLELWRKHPRPAAYEATLNTHQA